MHPHQPRGLLRYLLVGLLVAALIVLFPVTAKSHHQIVELVLALF
ncbi:MAG TPA: hypothetical protein VFU86_23970 [Terriglobales bacterium]|nr:hypothetical protein [Terriglobales bacterium]